MTHNQLKKALRYDPHSGSFTRRFPYTPGYADDIPAGYQHSNGYRYIKLFGQSYAESRLAHFYMTGQWPTHTIDHINHNRADNRWINLRDIPLIDNVRHSFQSNRPRANYSLNRSNINANQ